MAIKNSIIIPTYNKLETLKHCVESIIQHTDLTETEVIIVSNGCKDGTVEYIKGLGNAFKVIHWPEPVGYPNAVNIGICVSRGEYIIQLNNDVVLMAGNWLQLLLEPFTNHKTAGVTGLVKGNWNNSPWGIFFCAAFKKEVVSKIGLLDTIFSPGTGEDVDFCLKAVNAGYTVHQVPEQVLPTEKNNHNFKIGPFPIWHKGSSTFNELDRNLVNETTKRSFSILESRYGVQYPSG
jgi:GT2 family glycosyltransferase